MIAMDRLNKQVDKLTFRPEFMPLILNGKKTSTIRMGLISVASVHIRLISGLYALDAIIDMIDYRKTLSDLTEQDASTDGFESLDDLRQAIKRIYPSASDASRITILHFHLIPGADSAD